jgi:hypothetical protein
MEGVQLRFFFIYINYQLCIIITFEGCNCRVRRESNVIALEHHFYN